MHYSCLWAHHSIATKPTPSCKRPATQLSYTCLELHHACIIAVFQLYDGCARMRSITVPLLQCCRTMATLYLHYSTMMATQRANITSALCVVVADGAVSCPSAWVNPDLATTSKSKGWCSKKNITVECQQLFTNCPFGHVSDASSFQQQMQMFKHIYIYMCIYIYICKLSILRIICKPRNPSEMLTKNNKNLQLRQSEDCIACQAREEESFFV